MDDILNDFTYNIYLIEHISYDIFCVTVKIFWNTSKLISLIFLLKGTNIIASKINKQCKKKIDSLINKFMKNNFTILYISVILFLIIYHLYNQIRTPTMNFYACDILYSNMPCHFISKAIKKAT